MPHPVPVRWNVFEEKEEICTCIYSVPWAAQYFPSNGGNNEGGLALGQGRIWGLESVFPFADALPLTFQGGITFL